MEIYEKENTKSRKKKLAETKKQIEDYNMLHSDLLKVSYIQQRNKVFLIVL